MPPQFQWLQFGTAKQALAGRLADPTNAFWTDIENGYYLAEALRTWNALTEQWNADFVFTPAPGQVWYNLSTMVGSPRLRTLTDNYLYTVMQYQLLEPPSGGTWSGTSQFNIADLAQALQRRRDEMIQSSGCNLVQLAPINSTPNTRRVYLPDNSLEPRRTRFLPAPGFGNPMTLPREDTLAWDDFEADHLQTTTAPSAWSVITGPPLAVNVDTGPNFAGQYDIISLISGNPFVPPAATLLSVPDDWSWVAKWGALADLLGRDSEATDRLRADYCLRRFQDGLKIMQNSNWLLQATINGVPVDTPSVIEMDGYSPEWQEDANAWPSLVTAGMDFFASCPVGPVPRGVSLIVVGNAPVPVVDTDFVQVSRDVFDAILDYAQLLASFKMGGQEFQSALTLEQNFFLVAQQTNVRLAKMGIFRDMLGLEGERQNINQPR